MNHEGGRQIIMKDAQGNIIQLSRMRKVNFAMMGKDGIPVNFVSSRGKGETSHPVCWASTTQWMGDEEKRRWPESLAQARS